MISLLTINVRGVSNKHCLLPFFIKTIIAGVAYYHAVFMVVTY